MTKYIAIVHATQSVVLIYPWRNYFTFSSHFPSRSKTIYEYQVSLKQTREEWARSMIKNSWLFSRSRQAASTIVTQFLNKSQWTERWYYLASSLNKTKWWQPTSQIHWSYYQYSWRGTKQSDNSLNHKGHWLWGRRIWLTFQHSCAVSKCIILDL